MKKVLRLIAVFAMLWMGANITAFAQSPEKIAKKVAKEVEMRAGVMKLDTVQQSKVKVVLTTFYNDRNEAKKLEGKARGAKMREAKEKMSAGMSKVCTPQQLEAWNKHLKATAAPKEKKNK